MILAPLFAGKIVSPADIIQRKVNSVFHIEPSDPDKGKRGSVIELDKFDNRILESLNIYDINEWFNKLFPFKTNAKGIVQKRFIRRYSKLIAIELSAACDYSNKKPRINKYVLGFLTPCFDTKNDIPTSQRIESSCHLGGCDFNLGDENFQIWLNLNFVFGVRSDDPRLGESLFIMKKEIMDMLGNKYASHVSRIGITSF